jgi:cell division protein FtsA
MNNIKFETTNNLFLLINFSDNFISTAVIEHSKKQSQSSVLCYRKEYCNELVEGRITDISKVSDILKRMLVTLRKNVNLNLPFETIRTIVSISNRTGEIRTSHGILNFLSNPISHDEIDRVVKAALYNSKISNETYQILNLTVNSFTADDMNNVKNPLAMSCQCLQANVSIEIANKTSIFNNFNTVLKNNNLNIEYISFASSCVSESVLNHDDKEFGVITLEIKNDASVITFFKNGNVQEYIQLPKQGTDYIIEQIAKQYKLSFKTAEWIYLNIETIIDKTNNQGVFELINSNNHVLQIELEYLNSIIINSFKQIFINLKEEIDTRSTQHYLNGLLFLHTFKFSGIEVIFDEVFVDYVRNSRNISNSDNINKKNIFNCDILENDISLIGMINKLSNNNSISYNYLNKLVGTDGSQNTKPSSERQEQEGGFDLSNLNPNRKKINLVQRTKKLFKSLW